MDTPIMQEDAKWHEYAVVSELSSLMAFAERKRSGGQGRVKLMAACLGRIMRGRRPTCEIDGQRCIALCRRAQKLHRH